MSQRRRFQEVTMTESERAAFLERIRVCAAPEDYQKIEGMCYALPELLTLIAQDPMTLRKLRHLLFGPKTEKLNQVCPPATAAAPAEVMAQSLRVSAGHHDSRRCRETSASGMVAVELSEISNECRHQLSRASFPDI